MATFYVLINCINKFKKQIMNNCLFYKSIYIYEYIYTHTRTHVHCLYICILDYHTNDIFIQYFLICSPSCTADNVDKNLLKITVTRVKDRCIYKCYKT